MSATFSDVVADVSNGDTGKVSSGGWRRFRCVFHEDHARSAAVHDGREVFRCFSDECADPDHADDEGHLALNPLEFAMRYLDTDDPLEAADWLEEMGLEGWSRGTFGALSYTYLSANEEPRQSLATTSQANQASSSQASNSQATKGVYDSLERAALVARLATSYVRRYEDLAQYVGDLVSEGYAHLEEQLRAGKYDDARPEGFDHWASVVVWRVFQDYARRELGLRRDSRLVSLTMPSGEPLPEAEALAEAEPDEAIIGQAFEPDIGICAHPGCGNSLAGKQPHSRFCSDHDRAYKRKVVPVDPIGQEARLERLGKLVWLTRRLADLTDPQTSKIVMAARQLADEVEEYVSLYPEYQAWKEQRDDHRQRQYKALMYHRPYRKPRRRD